MLTTSAVCLLSCATVDKAKELNKSSVACGTDTTVWESLPASEHIPYDVTLSIKASKCFQRLLVQDSGGNWTTNTIDKVKGQVYPGATKIVLQCVSSDLPIAKHCSYTVHDVRKSPTDTTATVSITNLASIDFSCGTTNVAFSTTNTAGAEVTLLWKNGLPCNISLIAERARGAGTVTNVFLHNNNPDNQLSTIHAVKKLYVTCGGSMGSGLDCSYQIVETEYP